MIYVGLDDTDMPDTPGTVHLARHLMHYISDRFRGTLITRHQLLEDPRVPCTRKNGCVAVTLESASGDSLAGIDLEALADELTEQIIPRCPEGSDPGLCIAIAVPADVIKFGRRCQRDFVTQSDARELAISHGITLRGIAGDEGGVIGALAAVGLTSTGDDGRVIFFGRAAIDPHDITGVHEVIWLRELGVDRVLTLEGGGEVTSGTVELGKRLRPNLRQGRVVLFVSPSQEPGVDWHAERVV